jgi:hypothetical protein
MNAPKKSVNLAVVETRLDAQDKALSDLKAAHDLESIQRRADAKEILAEITKTNLSVAVLPKWEDIKKLHEETTARLASLESTRDQQKGGWKTLTVIGSICAAVGGWLGSAVSDFFSKASP